MEGGDPGLCKDGEDRRSSSHCSRSPLLCYLTTGSRCLACSAEIDSLGLGVSDLPVLEVAFARVFPHNSRRGDQDSSALIVVCDAVSTVFLNIT